MQPASIDHDRLHLGVILHRCEQADNVNIRLKWDYYLHNTIARATYHRKDGVYFLF